MIDITKTACFSLADKKRRRKTGLEAAGSLTVTLNDQQGFLVIPRCGLPMTANSCGLQMFGLMSRVEQQKSFLPT